MVYVFLAEGFEEIEALSVVDFLRRLNIPVAAVSLDGKEQVTGAHQITVKADCPLEEISLEKGKAFVLPGGLPGADNLQASGALKALLLAADKEKKIIGAICAAPKVLGAFGLLQNRRATCYPGFESELTGALPQTDAVVRDGHIITSRGVATAPDFAFALAEALGTDPQKIKTGMLFQK